MNKEIPQGWIECTLGDVVKVQNGYAFPSKDFQAAGVPVIRQSNLAVDRVSLENCVHLDPKWLKTKPEFVLRKNDVLIGMSGSLGKLCIYDLDQPALQNQRTGRIVPLSAKSVDWRYIWQYLKGIERQLLEKGKGLGVLNVSSADIESLPFRLAPLAEQRRIVVKLERLLGQVDASQRRLAKIPALLKRFRQSVLAAACSGRLTADWRETHSAASAVAVREMNRAENAESAENLPVLPEGWRWVRFGSVIGELRNGVSLRPSMTPPGIPILRISATRRGKVDLTDVRYMPKGDEFLPLSALRDGDLLFTRYNGSIELLGVCGMVRGLGNRPLLYPDKLMRVRFDHNWISPNYAEVFFSAPDVHERIVAKSKSSAGQNGVSGSDIKAQPFALPPLPEQQEIVRRVESLFALADRIEARFAEGRKRVDSITQAILAKAFRGELVQTEAELAKAEGRSFESADDLLKRIKGSGQVKQKTSSKRSAPSTHF